MTVWLDIGTVRDIHDEQLAMHGGAAGVRDEGLLESALARPLNLASYGEPDVAELAAAYAIAIARNHPFIDGNKRTAWVSCMVFLAMNGLQLRPDIDAAERLVIAVATGAMDEVKAISEALRELAE